MKQDTKNDMILVNVNADQMQVFVIRNNVRITKNVDMNLSKCECKYEKLCHFGEYLDYKNCKHRIIIFGRNKTPVEVIKEVAFRGTYFINIYSGVNGKWQRKSWKEFDELKNTDQKYYCSNYYNVSVNKYGVKCVTSLRFWENKGWINSIDPYGWFQWYFRKWLGRLKQRQGINTRIPISNLLLPILAAVTKICFQF